MSINLYGKAVCAVLASALLAGCASRASNISASYVSPLTYAPYDCNMISMEAARISSRAAQMTGEQDSKATNDAVATGVALVLFWPAAFMIKGDGASAAELGRLKGEMEAIQQASIQKGCGVRFQGQKVDVPLQPAAHVAPVYETTAPRAQTPQVRQLSDRAHPQDFCKHYVC